MGKFNTFYEESNSDLNFFEEDLPSKNQHSSLIEKFMANMDFKDYDISILQMLARALIEFTDVISNIDLITTLDNIQSNTTHYEKKI